MRRSSRSVLAVVSFVLLLCFVPSARGQGTASAVFSKEAQAKLDRLLAIGKGLPADEWRYYAGDLPHGEDVALDDSSWKIAPHRYYNLPEATAWLRSTLVVPAAIDGYSLQGARLYFKFGAAANGGLPEILYVNGNRVALGEDLEPILLTSDAKPGETFHLAVKLLHTEDEKRMAVSTFEIQMPANRPNPVALGVEIESAALLLPTITTDAKKLAEQMGLLETALDQLDVKALESGDQAKFNASVELAQRTIEPLQPVLQTLSMRLVGNSHMDTAWLWPWTETVDTAKRTFSTALQLMSEYPNYKYSQSYSLYYQWMQEKYPYIFNEIQDRVKQGRWEVVGGMWVEPDLNMPDGESQVRQLLVGKSYIRKQMGIDVNVGWNPDSFGYNWQLPQIYRKSGINYFVTQKLTWNDTNPLPLKLFWWQAPDGSRVLAYFPHDYTKDPIPFELAKDMTAARKLAPGEDSLMHLYGVGDHGGGPTRAILDYADAWMQPDMVYPKMEYSTAGAFFADVSKRVNTPASIPVWNYSAMAKGPLTLPPAADGQINIPVWSDELYLEFHRGVYTSQAAQKRNMREAEERMLNAEKVASLAWLGGEAYPAVPLNESWKKVLMNQFHDTASGSGIAPVYIDAQRDYDSVQQVTGEITHSGLEEIAAHVDTQTLSGAVPLFVFNPLAWKRTDIVEADVQLAHPAAHGIQVTDADGKPVLAQVLEEDKTTGRYHLLIRAEDVPSMGYSLLQVGDANAPAKSDLSASDTTLENEFLKVVVDPSTGCITHLISKPSGFDSIAAGGCGNELQAFTDTPKQFDAWNIDADALTKMTPIHEVDSVKLVEHGALRSSLRIERHWGKSTFVQYLRLYAGVPRVDVFNDFDWQETHVLLKAAFPLAASSAQATYEIPYGTIERPTTRSNSVDKAKFEVPALRWADLGDGGHGFSLINETKYGYDDAGNVLRLSLLRSPMYPAPDADKGRQQFLYSLYPHAGTWQQAMTVRRGYEFNYKLTAMQVEPHAGDLPASHSFLAVDGDAVVVTALKKAEDADGLILRMYEWQGKTSPVRITVPGSPKSAEEVGMMENDARGAQTLDGNTIVTTAKPFEIKTILIHYPEQDKSFWKVAP